MVRGWRAPSSPAPPPPTACRRCEEEAYWHVEFRSRVFRFVDDVEFLFGPAGRQIHVRSASRVGYSDFGANRRRIEEIRALFR